MYLRNKGTVSKPKWQIVESRRIYIDGKKTPRQKVICTFGDMKDSAKVKQRWGKILDNARTAQRRHWDIKFRNKKFPLVKQYARRMSFDEIKARHDKIVAVVERMEWRQKGIGFKKQLKIKIERGIRDDTIRTQEFSMRLTALLATMADILAYDNLKHWPIETRNRMRERLGYVTSVSYTHLTLPT